MLVDEMKEDLDTKESSRGSNQGRTANAKGEGPSKPHS